LKSVCLNFLIVILPIFQIDGGNGRTGASKEFGVENKKVIHIWVADYAKERDILRMLSHEIGHIQRPYKRIKSDEEAKAEVYSAVTLIAYDIMKDLQKGGEDARNKKL